MFTHLSIHPHPEHSVVNKYLLTKGINHHNSEDVQDAGFNMQNHKVAEKY